MKRFVFGLLALSALLLAACAAPAAAPTEEPAPPAEEEMAQEEMAEEEAMPEEEMAEEEAMPEEEMAEEEPAAEAPAGPVVYVIQDDASSVRYEVEEIFFENNELVTAVGVTNVIEGSTTFDAADPASMTISEITIDISQFTSDRPRRDEAIRNNWLESATFPIATFVPTEISGLPATYTEGEEMTLQITGDLTVRDTTVPTTFDAVVVVEGGQLTGTAETMILMTDFGFDPPAIGGILEADNEARLVFEIVAAPEA